ncbi:MAG: hypothetical protein JNK79_01680 [Chitinophagaceae bacterium]|nr:hypothetical protein [Chitinophagaceae bacterium]
MKLTAFCATLLLPILLGGCVKDIGTQKNGPAVASEAGGGGGIDPTYTPPLFQLINTKTLSSPRIGHAAAGIGSKVVFAGGATPYRGGTVVTSAVDIFDVTTLEKTTANLSVARKKLSAAAWGNKIVFAGGITSSGASSKVVDIYDVVANTWSTAQLSEARYDMAAAAAGGKIVFAAGRKSAGVESLKVDIYEVATGMWSTNELSSIPRVGGIWGAAAGNRIVFAGLKTGYEGILADVYNVTTGGWTLDLHNGYDGFPVTAAAGAYDKVIFLSNPAYVFKPTTLEWWEKNAYTGQSWDVGAGSIDDYVLFAGGTYAGDAPELEGFHQIVDVYNARKNSKTHFYMLEEKTGVELASASNKMFIAGGDNGSQLVNTVEIYKLNKPPTVY